MLVLDKRYMEMTIDFEGKVVVRELLLRFLKKTKKKGVTKESFKANFITYI